MVLKSCYQLTAGSEILTQLCKTSKFHQKFESQNLGSQLCKRYQRSNFSQILAPETPVASAARLQLGKPSSWQGQLVRHRGIQGRTRKGPIGTAVDARQNPGWLIIFFWILHDSTSHFIGRIHELWESHGNPVTFRFHDGNFWWWSIRRRRRWRCLPTWASPTFGCRPVRSPWRPRSPWGTNCLMFSLWPFKCT